jgi:hypothetical protein
MSDRINSSQADKDAAWLQADKDAAWGNERIKRSEFILEEMRQTGCLAIEAAERWDAGER